MIGGILTTSLGYYFILKSPSPLYDSNFHIPVFNYGEKPLIAYKGSDNTLKITVADENNSNKEMQVPQG